MASHVEYELGHVSSQGRDGVPGDGLGGMRSSVRDTSTADTSIPTFGEGGSGMGRVLNENETDQRGILRRTGNFFSEWRVSIVEGLVAGLVMTSMDLCYANMRARANAKNELSLGIKMLNDIPVGVSNLGIAVGAFLLIRRNAEVRRLRQEQDNAAPVWRPDGV